MSNKKKTASKRMKKLPEGKHGKILAEWQFSEYEKHERGKEWFITAGIVGISLVVWAIVTTNFLFALIIIMIAVIILTHHYNEPTMVEFQITEDGLQLGEHFYDFDELDTFWIIYEPPEVKKLYFQFKSWLRPRLSVSLLDKNPLVIRNILLKYLEENLEEESEPATDILGRRWKL